MKKTNLAILLMLICVSVLVSPVKAEESYCTDHHAHKVKWIKDSGTGKIASAGRLQNGIPVIRYNPDLLPDLSLLTRKFAMNRACGNHVLGNNMTKPARVAEQFSRVDLADCLAISRMFYSEGISYPAMSRRSRMK